jgi:type III restriction enzyme
LALTLHEAVSPQGVEVPTEPQPQTLEVAKFVANYTSKSVMDLNRQVKTFAAIKDDDTRAFVKKTIISETLRQFPSFGLKPEDLAPVVENAISTCVQALTDSVIPIPQAVVQPFTEVKQGFYPFKLDTRNMNWHPSDDTLLGTELQEGGQTFELDIEYMASAKVDTVENEIVRHIIVHDNVDYGTSADLLYSLVNDAKEHFLLYLSEEETEKVMRDRQKTIADIIYLQMNQHFYREETEYKASEMRPFSRIENSFGGKIRTDDIYDLRATLPASEVRSKVFNGFKKACHTLYKFDSDTERRFAIVLENDKAVLKWLRPSPKQFNIYYGPGGISRYEPDFVVETADRIYMIETKASNEIGSTEVKEKARAAVVYCNAVTDWNSVNSGKPWRYALISHDEVRLNSSFMGLVSNQVSYKQLEIDDMFTNE